MAELGWLHGEFQPCLNWSSDPGAISVLSCKRSAWCSAAPSAVWGHPATRGVLGKGPSVPRARPPCQCRAQGGLIQVGTPGPVRDALGLGPPIACDTLSSKPHLLLLCDGKEKASSRATALQGHASPGYQLAMPGTRSLTLPGITPSTFLDEAQPGQSLVVHLHACACLLGFHHKQRLTPKRVHSPATAVG